jgi:hypothetical protein
MKCWTLRGTGATGEHAIVNRPDNLRETPPDYFDALQLVLIATALVVDAVALAALSENLILLVNLAGLEWLYARFLRHRGSFAALERRQTRYLPRIPSRRGVVVTEFSRCSVTFDASARCALRPCLEFT